MAILSFVSAKIADNMNSKIAFIVPTYNEFDRLEKTISGFKSWLAASDYKSYICNFIIIDDGSKAKVELDNNENCYILRHVINLGQGAALQTGIEFACQTLEADFIITIDSDGQHQADDLPAILDPLLKDQADIVFGNRFQFADSAKQVPYARRKLLGLASLFEWALTGLNLKDAHNGYRAMSRKIAEQIDLTQNRMAHATEIKQQIAALVRTRAARYCEVPVTIKYSDETLQKGQRGSGAIRILKELLDGYLYGD